MLLSLYFPVTCDPFRVVTLPNIGVPQEDHVQEAHFNCQFTPPIQTTSGHLRVVRVGGDDGELRTWHYIDAYSIESRLIMRVRYDSYILSLTGTCGAGLAGAFDHLV